MRFHTAFLALICFATAVAGPKMMVGEMRQLLEQKADRYPGAVSVCIVDHVTENGIGFTSRAGSRRQNHEETVSFDWFEAKSATVIPHKTHKGMFTVVIKLKKPIQVDMSTTHGGQTQSQHGMDDQVEVDFAKQKDAKRFKYLADQMLERAAHRINE